MTTISNSIDPLADLRLQEETVPIDDGSNQTLTQEDFFSLLTEQLANQDPTAPVDNDQMVAQMTSFTMADGIQELNDQFSTFAASMNSNQALQASLLIGQDVLVSGAEGYLAEDGTGISGVVVNEATAQDMTISIFSETGELVKTIDAGTQAAGNVEFSWDGTDENGNQLPAGKYLITAEGTINDENQLLNTAVNRHVDSVSLGGTSGVVLNLDGDVSISLDDVIQIG